MKQILSEELIAMSAMMLTAKTRGEFVGLSSQMNALVEQAMELERQEPKRKEKTLSATIKFSKEEVAKMSKTFKKEFIAGGFVAHIIKRPSGKSGFYYEIRYRRNGYNITASNKNLAKAKELFIAATYTAKSNPKPPKSSFGNIVDEWLDYKRGKVGEKCWENYRYYCKRYFTDEWRKRDITSIRAGELDAFMRGLTPRTYEDIRIILNAVFKYARASGIITHNPVELVPFKRAERKPRESLSEEQILAFFCKIKQEKYDAVRQSAYAMYFFGLRPCELDAEAHFENGFLIARNRKRKGGKIEYKKIPVPKQAQGLIDFDRSIAPLCDYNEMARLIKDALGGTATSYYFRHTFASTCAKYVRQDIVEIWLGDSPERLIGQYYVHFSDDFMKKEMEKVLFLV